MWDDKNVNVSIENQKKKIQKNHLKKKFRQMNVGYGISCIPFLGALLTILNEHTP